MADSRNFLEVDIVKQALEIAHRHIAEEATRAFWWQCQFYIGSSPEGLATVESPAEAVFQVCFLGHQLYERDFSLRPQMTIEANGERYRFDFVLQAFSDSGPLKITDLPIAVEIDGHQWHEKTLEQVTRRNRRDRAVQCAGYTVFHFSFSELMKDPMSCVAEVVAAGHEYKAKWMTDNAPNR